MELGLTGCGRFTAPHGGNAAGGRAMEARAKSRLALGPRRRMPLEHLAARRVRPPAVTAAVGVDQRPEGLLTSLGRGQERAFHRLPSGLRMEVIRQGAGERHEPGLAPLVFVHGSYHAAWCWACCWLPYFAALGHDCYAVSLLGQGASDVPSEKLSFSLQSHAGDLAHFVRFNLTVPPVLVGHSFGGLIVQWYLSQAVASQSDPSDGETERFPTIAAAALLCSIPPTGNGPMVMRFLKRDVVASIQMFLRPCAFGLSQADQPHQQRILASWKITLSLAAKLFGSSLSLCRKSFFSPHMSDEEVRRYQQLLKASSRYPMLDLRKLKDSLPLPRPRPGAPPVFVLAAENDFVVDREGSEETAEWFGAQPVIIEGSGHDVMLDTAWETAAKGLKLWLDQQAM